MSAAHFASAADLAASAGRTLGPGEWFDVRQETIDGFADVTGDHQWIHVDPERAAREAPGGTTIAHGFLTLGLIGTLQPTAYHVDAARVVNYGAERLRFLSPVPVGAAVRLVAEVVGTDEIDNGWRITTRTTIEIRDAERPALVVDLIFLYLD